MVIKIFKDLGKYVLTSTLKTADIELVKKYKPDELIDLDGDGNVKFALSYNQGHACISAKTITFGAASHEGGFAQITGDLPTNVADDKFGEFIADIVGAVLPFVTAKEASIPSVAASIAAERTALINSITEG